MSRRVKGRKMVPVDYDDADVSDSDIFNDPDYLLQEPPSPKLSQDNGCATYNKRLRQNPKKSEATPKSTQGGQGAPVTPLSGTSDAGTRKRAREQKLKGQIATVKAPQNKLQAKTDRISSTSSHDEEDAVSETPIKKNTIVTNHLVLYGIM